MADLDTALIALGRQFGVTRQPDDDSEAFIRRVNAAAQNCIAASKSERPPRPPSFAAQPASLSAYLDEAQARLNDQQARISELQRKRGVDARAFGEQVKRIDELEKRMRGELAEAALEESHGPTFVCSVPYGEEPVDGWRDTKPIHRGAALWTAASTSGGMRAI